MTGPSARAWWRWLRTVGALLAVVAAVEYGVVPRIVEAASELSLVSDLSPWLVLGAWSLELLSLAAYTGLTQRLMGAFALPWVTQLQIDLTGYGLSHVRPGGGAAAAAVRYRLMVARGAPEGIAASLAALQAVLAVAGLVAVWGLGSLLSLPRTGSAATVVILAVIAAAAVAGGEWLEHGARVGPSVRRRLAPVVRRVPSRLRTAVLAAAGAAGSTIRNRSAMRRGLAWSCANWLLDAVCLWLCLRGYGAEVPPELVLVSYGLAMLVGLLPFTPGGVGVVEGVLVSGLVAAGAPGGPVVLGVLTWRLMQFWLPIPMAAVCWLTLVPRRPARPVGPAGQGTADIGGDGTLDSSHQAIAP